VQDFRKLKVWQKAHELALAIYRVTAKFPKEELYGLTSQIRRASISIPTNIAEGCGRSTDSEFARYLQIAMGSAFETEYELLLSRDLGFLAKEEYSRLDSAIQETKRMIIALYKTLRTHHQMLKANS
jgi:four helix bundle protein